MHCSQLSAGGAKLEVTSSMGLPNDFDLILADGSTKPLPGGLEKLTGLGVGQGGAPLLDEACQEREPLIQSWDCTQQIEDDVSKEDENGDDQYSARNRTGIHGFAIRYLPPRQRWIESGISELFGPIVR